MSGVRVVFLGTPQFSVPSLRSLHSDPRFEVVHVVSQPDRPRGRNQKLSPSPVKELALELGLPVSTPKRADEILPELKSTKAEMAVVVAFGQILSPSFLASFPKGVVNVHASLLPRWRGAAPIQRALEAGDAVSGVTLQRVVPALDAGDVISERQINIEELDANDLFQRFADLGAELLQLDLYDYWRGQLVPKAQDESRVTLAKKVQKSESEINWSLSASVLHNQIRAFAAGPGSFTLLLPQESSKSSTSSTDSPSSLASSTLATSANQVSPLNSSNSASSPKTLRIKILKTSLVNDLLSSPEVDAKSLASKNRPGRAMGLKSGRLFVETGDELLEVLALQPESKTALSAKEFVQGYGSRFRRKDLETELQGWGLDASNFVFFFGSPESSIE